MKIAMLTSVYGEHAIGGAERSAARMVSNLVARGHFVEVITLSAPSTAAVVRTGPANNGLRHIPLRQIYDPYGLDGAKPTAQPAIKRLAWHGLDIYNPWMTSEVKRQLKQIRPDVLFTHATQGFSVGVWAAAKQLGIQVIHMVHDHALVCPGTAMTRGSIACETPCTTCQVFSTLRHIIAASPDAVVGPSQLILDRHHRFGWFRDVPITVVIGNAIPEDWPPAPGHRDLPSPTRPRPMVFGFLGRMDESKGVDTLLIAASRFTPDQCQLRLAGSGQPQDVAKHFSGKPQMLEFCGVVDAAAFLAGIDVLVAMSRAHETFCNVVMEAACLGIPAIVSDRGALPERVLQGESGWIIPAGDADQLATSMAYCMAHPEAVRAKGQIALSTRVANSEQAQTDKLEDLLAQVLSNRNPSAS